MRFLLRRSSWVSTLSHIISLISSPPLPNSPDSQQKITTKKRPLRHLPYGKIMPSPAEIGNTPEQKAFFAFVDIQHNSDKR